MSFFYSANKDAMRTAGGIKPDISPQAMRMIVFGKNRLMAAISDRAKPETSQLFIDTIDALCEIVSGANYFPGNLMLPLYAASGEQIVLASNVDEPPMHEDPLAQSQVSVYNYKTERKLMLPRAHPLGIYRSQESIYKPWEAVRPTLRREMATRRWLGQGVVTLMAEIDAPETDLQLAIDSTWAAVHYQNDLLGVTRQSL